MATRKKRGSRRVSNMQLISVWGALNQPVVAVTPEAGKQIIFAAILIIFFAWLAPYWGSVSTPSFSSSPLVGEERWGGNIAGAQIIAQIDSTPQWYFMVSDIPFDVAKAFATAANQVLDISEPVGQMAEYYTPGTSAVWDAWTDLMADPY